MTSKTEWEKHDYAREQFEIDQLSSFDKAVRKLSVQIAYNCIETSAYRFFKSTANALKSLSLFFPLDKYR